MNIIEPQSAEKVQSDINTILEAIARFLSKINLEIPPPEPKLPPKDIDAWLAEEKPFVDVEVIPEKAALAGRDQALLEGADPPLLEGRDPLEITGSPTPPQLKAEVRLQIETTYIIAQLPTLKPQLEQLAPEQLANLAGAIDRPATETGEVRSGELMDIQINGVQCFHQEQGQVTVNDLLPDTNPIREPEPLARMREVTKVTEIGEKTPDLPTIELRPAHEVESLTGQAIGDSSTLHEQVLHDAAPVLVQRDQYGHIKGGTAVRAPVEVTEDAVEAEVEYRAEYPLTPQAKAVVQELHDYFDRTGERSLGGSSYAIKQLDQDRLQFIPYDAPGECFVVDRDQATGIDTERFQTIMVRFAAAYESLRTAERSQEQNFELSR